MGALAMRHLPPITDPSPPRPAQARLFALPGGAAAAGRGASAAPRTLDDVVGGAWSALTAGQAAACPVCAEPMLPRWSAGAGAVGGRCGSCGTTLD